MSINYQSALRKVRTLTRAGKTRESDVKVDLEGLIAIVINNEIILNRYLHKRIGTIRKIK